MARFVVFNGNTLVHPGAATKINVQEMSQAGLGVTGVVGIIGEAEGGKPNSASEKFIPVLYDSSKVKEIYKNGPLADAIMAVFTPSNDPRIPSGAFAVLPVKVNQGTRASAYMFGQTGYGCETEHQVQVQSLDYGVDTNLINLFPEVDPTNPYKYQVTIRQQAMMEILSDLGGQPLMNLSFKGPEEPLNVYEGTAAAGSTQTTILDASVPGGILPGMFVYIPPVDNTQLCEGEWRRVVSSVAGVSITVASNAGPPPPLPVFPGFSSAPNAGTGYIVVSLMVYRGPVVSSSNLTGTNPIIIIGGPTDSAGQRITDISGQFDGLYLRVMSGDSAGAIRKIQTSASSGASLDIELTLEDDHNFSTQLLDGDEVAIIDITAATATITGSAGASVQIETTITWGNSVEVGPHLPTVDQTIALSATKAISQLAKEFNSLLADPSQPTAGSNYIALVGYGRNSALFSSIFDFDSKNTNIDISVDRDLFPYTHARFTDDLNILITEINQRSGLITMTRSTAEIADLTKVGAGFPTLFTEDAPLWLSGGTRGTSKNSDWQQAFDDLIKERVNIVVPLISRDLSEEGYGSDAQLKAVHMMLKDHVWLGRGIAKSERIGYASIYAPGNGALKKILDRAALLNDEDIALCYQSPTILDVDSNLVKQQPWAMATLAAGMQAGSPIGTPLTFKYVKVSDLDNNSPECDPLDRSTSNQLLLGGVLFAEPVRGRGFRWVRGLSTWAGVDNLAKTDLSVNEIVKFIAYETRTMIEDSVTGTMASKSLVGAIKATLASWLENYRNEGIIIDGNDPVSGATRYAYTISKCTLYGDILNIEYSIIPAPGINYELITINVQLPVLSA